MDMVEIEPWPVYSPGAEAAVTALVRSGLVFDYSGKKPVIDLEEEFAALHGGAHVISFNSGTSALFAAMCAVGIGEGDEVIVPNLTFLASASPLMWLGSRPILVDSDPEEPSISPKLIESAITSRTKAVVVTHLFGNPVDIVAISAICAKHDIRLIEDCSHAHASTVGSRHVGTFGDVAIYSIGAGKLISGGHGGLLVTGDPIIRDLALLIGHYKPRTRVHIVTESLRRYAEFALGGNLRLSPLAAALALDHVRTLDVIAEGRCANAAVLDEAFYELLTPVRSPSPRHNRSHFDLVYKMPANIPTSARRDLLTLLNDAGVPASAPSTRPLNRVLQSIAAETASIPNILIQRLNDLSHSALADSALPNSTGQHDRMISFPANLLYRVDTKYAQSLSNDASHVIRKFTARYQ